MKKTLFIVVSMLLFVSYFASKKDVKSPESPHLKEIVVDLVDGIGDSDLMALKSEVGHEFSTVYEPRRLVKVTVDPSSVNRVLTVLRHNRNVEAAGANILYSIPEPPESVPVDDVSDSPNDPLFKFQWHMTQVKAPQAWTVTRGENAVVAVIDTGVTHTGRVVEDLVGAEFVHPYNFINNTENANDDHGHGTHVACTIAEVTNNKLGGVGVAPKAKIMPLKVLSRSGSGTVSAIAAAIMYAADKGANVINMSLGSSVPSSVMENAVNYAHAKGVIVVCAAGNSGPREGTVGYPAAYENAVAVSAVDAVGELTWYSSWGPEVDIAAPGGDLRADKNKDGKPDGVLQNTIVMSDKENMARYEMYQGTSMASPHAAGVAALIVSQGVKNPVRVLQIMQETVQKKGDPKKYGAGLVDAFAAASAAQSHNIMDRVSEHFGFPPVFGTERISQ